MSRRFAIGVVADAYDNALAESFVDSFKTELIADRVWRSPFQLELAVVESLGWFNTARLHQALGDAPPAEFEALTAPQVETITSTMIKLKPPNPASAKGGTAHRGGYGEVPPGGSKSVALSSPSCCRCAWPPHRLRALPRCSW